MSEDRKREEALIYHAKPKPGKIEVIPTKKYTTQRDLSVAYSPYVAYPCLEIKDNPEDVYRYTNKGNLVAVITNGTAVLGLGNIGPEASKPVMEGKGLLFKIFAGIDVFDIEVDTNDVDEFVSTVKNIAQTFGGINLEDIKSPEAFEIERRLKEELDIPVMHDDQHGTAIISAAALLNAVELADKEMHNIKVVISGAGAAAVSCGRLYKSFGVQAENMVMTDSKGVIRKDRKNLSDQKTEFATERDINTLEDAMENADVFVGLSVGNIVSEEMLLSMADNPIVFAMANPDPEITYDKAVGTRKDVIMATGRSDYPNQVNNVLGFPFIFRGALDVRATEINEEMKMAAVRGLAALAKKPVPEEVNITYGKVKLNFGREYIIPKPFDTRLITEIPPAVAKAAMESGVARQPIKDWNRYHEELEERLGNDNKITRQVIERAKANPKRVVYAEADQLDVLKAAQLVMDEGIAEPVLLGNKKIIGDLMNEIDFKPKGIRILDPKSEDHEDELNYYAEKFWHKRRRNGITLLDAKNLMRSRNYFGAMMVNEGDADALLSGYTRAYPIVLKPIFELMELQEGVTHVATTNLMNTSKGPIFVSDTAINIDPDADTLTKIAEMTAETIKMFGIEPIMAMMSYANFGSSKAPQARKVKDAVEKLHEKRPDLLVDGAFQADFALNRSMRERIFPFSKIADRKVNTMIFPTLASANATYKVIKEMDSGDSIGPIMMGLSKSVHILQLGSSVQEIVNMSAIAVLDAQRKEKKATN
ncbi:MAG TPA: NADP-dependent malic enzyme [Flavobacteriaceae bacterium]|nr:NADP-dependent malic enzyme [Flavobacteriaceae bacterium]